MPRIKIHNSDLRCPPELSFAHGNNCGGDLVLLKPRRNLQHAGAGAHATEVVVNKIVRGDNLHHVWPHDLGRERVIQRTVSPHGCLPSGADFLAVLRALREEGREYIEQRVD